MATTGTTTAPANLTPVLHAAGTDWDDLRYKVEGALAEHYDETHPHGPLDDDQPFTGAAERWAGNMADKYLIALNPTKDV